MSATKDGCKKQVWRVVNFCRAAHDEEEEQQVAQEILGALLRNCQSDEHAAEVVTRFIERQHYPGDVVADLVAIARETEQHDKPPAGCINCEIGEDVSTGEMRWAAHVTVERNGVSCATRCYCSRGIWFSAKDAERAQGKLPEKRKAVKPMVPAADFARRAAGDVQ